MNNKVHKTTEAKLKLKNSHRCRPFALLQQSDNGCMMDIAQNDVVSERAYDI